MKIIYDKENNLFTIGSNGIGGAIISDHDLGKALNEYRKARDLADSVYLLLFFKENQHLLEKYIK